MSKEHVLLSGNYAAAYGAKLSQVEVIPIYPITPQTAIVEKLTEFVEKGDLLAELIHVESEHSAMASAIAAEAIGARTFTASSSQGICYMHENLFSAAGLRMPMVMAIVNRAITMPISIGPDHGDALAQRDTAWLQFYAENAQEVLDTIIQAYKVAEDPRVLLPAAVCFDGLIISHFFEPVEIPDQEEVTRFLGEYNPRHVLLDPETPMSLGIFANEFYVTEYRYQQQQAMENAKAVIHDVDEEYRRRFGRSSGGLAKGFMLEDAEIGIVAMGSSCTQIRRIVLALREQGLKVGAIKVRAFRPFPREELQHLAQHLKLLCVIDRDVSIGSGGILHSEVATAVHALRNGPRTVNFIMGLSGREVADDQLMNLIRDNWLEVGNASHGNPVKWVGVRE
jgi:pyruvate ferredoxin oxidoreductase alpha subunit